MLEIPESHTIATELNREISGKTIKQVVAGHSPHGFAWYFGEPSAYPDLLCGQRVDSARAIAGYVEIAAGSTRILFHDGVNIRLYAPGAKLPPKHQFFLELEDGSAIVCTVQMYGGIIACPKGAFENPYFGAARDKPSPLGDAFDEAYFEQLCSATPAKLSAKALLATEQRIPGLGNGCLQDILYAAKVHPQSKLSALSSGDFDALYQSVKGVLARMTRQGGRDTEKDLYGNPGGYHTLLSAKTVAYACPVCGGGITRKAYMGGNVYFCLSCQPVKK